MTESARQIGTLLQDILDTESEEQKIKLLSEFRARESELKQRKGVLRGTPLAEFEPLPFPKPSKGKEIPEYKGHPFFVWDGLLAPKHMKKIGNCLGIYLWCIARTTSEKDGIGEVLFGHEIPMKRISKELGFCIKKVQRDLDALVEHGYIEKTRGKKGLKIYVTKSKRLFTGAASRLRKDKTGISWKLRKDKTGISEKSFPQAKPFAPQHTAKN